VRIIALKHAEHFPLLEERFPAWTEKVEFWHIDDAPEALALIEREVMSLVARLLGGGERPDAPAPEIATEQASNAPAKKLGTVKVGRETAGRRGKGVTTVFDVPLDESGLKELADRMKTQESLRLQVVAYAAGDDLSASAARRLSLSRALAVRTFLIDNGVRSTRIDVRALGDKVPDQPANRVDLSFSDR
jgi:hypothetical protein